MSRCTHRVAPLVLRSWDPFFDLDPSGGRWRSSMQAELASDDVDVRYAAPIRTS